VNGIRWSSFPALEVGPAHHIGGRVRLTDGKPVPAGTRVTVGREHRNDIDLVLEPD